MINKTDNKFKKLFNAKSISNSDAIVESMIFEKISKLFISIDCDKDDIITAEDVANWCEDQEKVVEIPQEIYRLLAELVEELKHEESHIDLENFANFMRAKVNTYPSAIISYFSQALNEPSP